MSIRAFAYKAQIHSSVPTKGPGVPKLSLPVPSVTRLPKAVKIAFRFMSYATLGSPWVSGEGSACGSPSNALMLSQAAVVYRYE